MNYIPKTIHYAWFGRGQMGQEAKRCINSWRTILPDYEIIEWNEDNFPLDKYPYAKEAYEAGKYAYVSDVVRLYVLYMYGGIYMDTDVEVCKSLDTFLCLHAFSGFQAPREIPTGIIASEKQNGWVKEQLEYYENNHFNLTDITEKQITNVDIITSISLKKHNLKLNNKKQELKYGMVLFPDDYFCAKNPGTGELMITSNTYTIHHFAGSWVPKKNLRHKKINRLFLKLFGERITNIIYNVYKKLIH